MKILKKAYIVWHSGMISDHPEEGYRIDEIPPVFAESHAQAKSKSTLHLEYEIDGREPIWTDLKVKRAFGADLVEFMGAEVPRHRANAKKERIQRESQIQNEINSSDSDFFYLQTGVIGNCLVFWALNGRGYTCHLDQAHLFSKEEAIQRSRNIRQSDRFWEEDAVNSAASLQVDHQKLSSFSPIG